MRIANVVGICFMIFSGLSGQNFDRLDIPYFVNGTQNMGFTGGIRSPQFSNVDLNDDGIQDLFVFDRTSSKIYTFIKSSGNNTDYTYAPLYESYFPPMYNWATLKDYDGDGIVDLFTQSFALPQTISLFRGQKSTNGRLSFTLVTFPYGLQTILMIPANGGWTGIYVSNIDTPSIEDIDGDGDVDILAFDPGGSYVIWHRNMQVEEGLPKDTVKFKIEDICWGKFSENGLDDGVTLSTNPFSCAQGITSGNGGERHSGSTVSVFDEDRDGDYEIYLGDIGSTTITKLTNTGTSQMAYMTEAERGFPTKNVSPEIRIFLSVSFVDINGDNRKDMIVAANDQSAAQSADHIWAYLDKNTEGPSKFELLTKNFLVENIAFFNSGTSPVFMDVDQDGLKDIIVGTNGILKTSAKMQMMLLRNTGTATEPKYTLADNDLFKFSDVNTQTTGRLSPTIGDLDSDGDTDVLIGNINGSLFYIKNNKQGSGPNDFAPMIPFYDSISIGSNASPFIIDLDKDGKNDIVIGEKNNFLNFMKNIGPLGQPSFKNTPSESPNSEEVGNIFPTNDVYRKNADVCYVMIDDTLHLMLSYDSGVMDLYSNVTSNINEPYTLKQKNVGGIFFGNSTKFDLANIDGDPYYELVIGDDAGGLRFYNTPYKPNLMVNSDDEPITSPLIYFPNPCSNELYIDAENVTSAQLISNTGITIKTLSTKTYNDMSEVANGMYFIHIIANGKSSHYPLIVMK